MIQSKSQVFEFILYILIVYTIIVKLIYLFTTWNLPHLISPTVALVVGVLLIMKEPAAISWIKGWAVLEIAADSLVVLSSGCQLLIGIESDKTPLERILLFGGSSLGIVIASAFYFLVSDYLIVVPKPVDGSKSESDFELAEKLKLPKD